MADEPILNEQNEDALLNGHIRDIRPTPRERGMVDARTAIEVSVNRDDEPACKGLSFQGSYEFIPEEALRVMMLRRSFTLIGMAAVLLTVLVAIFIFAGSQGAFMEVDNPCTYDWECGYGHGTCGTVMIMGSIQLPPTPSAGQPEPWQQGWQQACVGSQYSDLSYETDIAKKLRKQLNVPSGIPSCAIVGSSGLLLHERKGHDIDQHEMVMRFNAAPVSRHEGIVGARTTVRMVSSKIALAIAAEIEAGGNPAEICPKEVVFCNCQLRRARETLRHRCENFTPSIIDLYEELPSGGHRNILHDTPVLKQVMSGKFPMSGIMGMALAMMMCPNGVDVYGFSHRGTLKFADQVPYHYFDEEDTWACADDLPTVLQKLSDFAEKHSGCLALDTPDVLLPKWDPSKAYDTSCQAGLNRACVCLVPRGQNSDFLPPRPSFNYTQCTDSK